MPAKRIQLTLFVDEQQSGIIEQVRKKYNPVQYGLIKSHVTLCREHELDPPGEVIETLNNLVQSPITIQFGAVTRFADGKGVLLPAAGDNASYYQLRKIALQKLTENPGHHEPHITLMHPRNSACNDSLFEEIQEFVLPVALTFNKISLIRQVEGKEWSVVREFLLR